MAIEDSHNSDNASNPNSHSTMDQDATICVQDNSTSMSPEEKLPQSNNMEEMIEHSNGRLNSVHILQTMLASLPSFFESQQTFISVFAHAQPKWHCDNTNSTSICSSSSNMCSLPKVERAWETKMNVHTSIISEWDLECSSWLIMGLPMACYFLGSLFGGFSVSTFADSSLGRKKLLCGSLLFMSIASLASSFSPNIWVYSGLRFLSGVGRASIAITSLVLMTEKVGKQWRWFVALMGLISFSLGFLVLTVIAYAIKGLSWRALYLFSSIPGIICSIISYLFLYESPRWLFLQGREIDAMVVLKKMRSISANEFLSSSSPVLFVGQKVSYKTNPLASVELLFKKGWAIKRLLACMILGFGIGLMIFGMFLGLENLGFNIYLTSIFASLLSISSQLLTFLFWTQRCNRRSSLLGLCIVGGAMSIAFSILNDEHRGIVIALEALSLFATSMANNLVFIYIVELFPTCVRNFAPSIVRQAMNLGSMFAPMLIIVGKKNKLYSFGLFGLVMILCAFVVFFLPETRGQALCDTMEEEEHRSNVNKSSA